MSDDTTDKAMPDLSRRDMLSTMGSIAAGAFLLPPHVGEAMRHAYAALAEVQSTGVAYRPKNFTVPEWDTVRLLVNYLIPRDRHSGSALDAGVPEFMDAMLGLEPKLVARHRDGLAWLNTECTNRFNKTFADSTDAERRQVLDDIAWPAKAPAAVASGVTWFNSFRDFTASGYYTSKIGIFDIGYRGNTGLAEWKGCPPAAVRHAMRGQ